jgi:hypothetical protein
MRASSLLRNAVCRKPGPSKVLRHYDKGWQPRIIYKDNGPFNLFSYHQNYPATMNSFDDNFDSLRQQFERDKQPISPLTLGAISKDGKELTKPPILPFHY